MQIKKSIILRFGLLYIGIAALAVVILGKALYLRIVEGDKYEDLVEEHTNKDIVIDANRGDILASDYRKLACSVPTYRIHMDMRAHGLTDEVFNANIDSLSLLLSHFYGDRSKASFKSALKKARAEGKRYYMVHPRRISFTELKRLKEFPIFRLGSNKGGFIPRKYENRKLPFGELAARTVGSLYAEKDLGGRFGLEMAYNSILRGVAGVSTRTRVSGNWVVEEQIEPVDGHDVVTTIDIGLQDVAESALLQQLQTHQADHGCAVLMEVATGKIRAIANLGQTSTGKYIEDYNYAIGEATEPGSTFKLASMIVALEDGVVKLTDSIKTGKGYCYFYDRKMTDSHHGGYGTLSVKEVFEKSSNVGISKIIFDNYRDNPRRYVDRLYSMNLKEPLGIEVKGEGLPMIKYPGEKTWSGVTLPWMSIGYEIQQTPLQVLTFYNAVANNGKMVKPMFVESIQHHGEVIKEMKPVVLNPSICSLETIDKVHEMLVGVVERGTARNIKSDRYQIAGKTGTAQISNETTSYSDKKHQASFVGYFPADKPLYTCIVVVNAPSNNVYYANVVAGSVFKEIADRVYAQSYHHDDIETEHQVQLAQHQPYSKGGKKAELLTVFNELGVMVNGQEVNSQWISASAREHEVSVKAKSFPDGIVPNVRGMGAKDAVMLLENMGMKVIIKGVGAVRDQSMTAGQNFRKGATIYLRLG
ncbi:transpeptidase family protein [Carboxylicivirga sediminis]|uniref:Transpeptidase family protein n=1 Tax=Carboxylicivirga sediminis TaxID=2006564 RepID=A0A941F757_9BACT|nr:penicillin-binding protein [Carboxylicivirga sediminis]MBR8538056.1 transpeptidase family protein [Carboxylicivirga sediminis]